MDVQEYRQNPREQARIDSLLKFIPDGQTVLDVGTRDGYLAQKLAVRYSVVTALDLEMPNISHPKIRPVKGNVGQLDFPDRSFDTVLCAEVLEHLPGELLSRACRELARVTKHNLVIGVPYKQDIRVGRSTCYTCGAFNPPWAHVNVFDEKALMDLFPNLHLESVDYVGENKDVTNWLSQKLMDYAGNPYGTYSQDEGCIKCGSTLIMPPPRNVSQKVCTKIAQTLNRCQSLLVRPRPNWIHVLFKNKKSIR